MKAMRWCLGKESCVREPAMTYRKLRGTCMRSALGSGRRRGLRGLGWVELVG